MRGGYRAGSGRKRGLAAKNAEEARRMLSERVVQEIGPIADALISKAREGDIRAIHELLDRAWGRAPQAIEIIDERDLTPEVSPRIKELADKLNALGRAGVEL
jgi:hypothetical protein